MVACDLATRGAGACVSEDRLSAVAQILGGSHRNPPEEVEPQLRTDGARCSREQRGNIADDEGAVFERDACLHPPGDIVGFVYHGESVVAGGGGATTVVAARLEPSPIDVGGRIDEALRRSARLTARRIVVETADGIVTLRGTVRSPSERKEAEWAAWGSPGVRRVRNRISILP